MESFASAIEIAAVVLAVAYVILAARQIVWCWPCAIVSTALYFVIFLEQAIYQQAALQLFYIGMGVYGWRKWRRGGERDTPLQVTNWRLPQHLRAIALVLALTAITGGLAASYTSPSMPYLDAFTAWGGVVTTWMMARKVLENWLYWLVIDSLMVLLSVRAGLLPTALLYGFYVGMVIVGFVSWRRSQLQQRIVAAG